MPARIPSAPPAPHHDDAALPPRHQAAIRVFGKLTIQFTGQPLEIRPPRRRAVLALLVMRAGTVVSIPTILESLWATDLPEHAVTTLQSYVSRLRKLIVHRPLADGSELTLQYRSHGYVLDVNPENIDAVRFEQLVTRGLAAERRGDRARAFALLSASLQEWTGLPFEDLPEYHFACQEAQRLSQLRLSAVEGRAEAALRLGRSGEILHDLEVEAALHPARERLVRLLMQAQYRDGRQADALQVFDRTRRYLSTELGVDVGPELRRTHEEILRQESSLAPAEAPAPAVPVLAVHAPVVPAPVPEPVENASALGQMPFIGRQHELEVLRAAVDRACDGWGGVVSLLGESGSGKTTLLREFRRHCAEREIDVLTVNCPKADALPAHWPWKQVLRAAAERWPQTINALPADVRATLVALLPDRQRAPEHTPCAPHPIGDFPLQEAVAQALLALGRRPLVLIIEDLHWADVASLRLLSLLASQLADSRLLLVGTSRTFRAGTDPEMRALLAAIRELPASDEITLGALHAEESRELARGAGRHLTDAVADALQRRTSGNPYFLVAVLKHLTVDTPAAAVESLLPEAVEEVVLERLKMLPGPVNDVLRACTVLGDDCTEPMLSRVVGGGDDGAAPAIQQAIRGGLLTQLSGERLEFVHPLLRDTVRRNLSRGELGKLHCKAVPALLHGAQLRDVRDSIGAHTRAALLSAPPAQVLRPHLDEVEKAVKLGLYGVGLDWLGLLADMLHTPAGDQRYAQAELHVQLLRLDLLNVVQETASVTRGELRERVQQLGSYLGSPQAVAILPSRLADQFERGDLSDAEATVVLLFDLAQQENDPYLEFVAHYGRGGVHFARGELAEAQAAMDDALAVADSGTVADSAVMTARWLYLCARLNKVVIQWLRGRTDDAWLDIAEIRRSQCRRGDIPAATSLVHTVEAMLRVFEDDPEGAQRNAVAAVEPTQREWKFRWQGLTDAVLLWAKARRGAARSADFDASRSFLAREELGGSRFITLGLALVADAERIAGHPREAHAYLRRLRRLVARTGEVVFLNELPTHLLPWRALPHAA